MKKSLLLASVAVLAMTANAQVSTYATLEELEAMGLTTDLTDLEAEEIIAQGEAGTLQIAYDEPWKIFNPYGSYKVVKVNDVEINLGDYSGLTGNNNPTFVSYADGVATAGAVWMITPAEDGWVTVFTKMNPNKQYVVFEGKQTPYAYTLGQANPAVAEDGTVTENQILYTLPYNPEDFSIDFECSDADYSKYFIGATVKDPETGEQVPVEGGKDASKPQFPYLVAGMEESPGEGTGFLTFNVLGGNSYYVFALGSKFSCGGFVLTEGDQAPTITYVATDTLPELTFEGQMEVAGVEGIAADPVNVNAPVYNLMGQKVNNDYKGVVIQNGKKFIRR